MRILQISSAKTFGGGERHFVDLCRGLTEQNHNVSVTVRADAVWLERLSFLPPEKIFYLPLRNSLDVFSARKLNDLIRRMRIQIAHAHLARDYPVAALAVRKTEAKIVLTRHLLFPVNSLHKFILPKDAAFIAVSKAVRQTLLDQRILPPDQIHLIYNGIDTKHFQTVSETIDRKKLRSELNIPEDAKIVGIAGEITEHKGQTDFVRAAEVLKDFPDTHFLIVGRDSSAHGENHKRLESLIAELGLQNKIHLSGFRADIAPFYAVLDVFVSASRVEPFGLVIAEAMACACAIVATATDGAKEIINDGESGKLVEIENPAAMARAISEFLGDAKMREQFGKDAQTKVRERFGLERMIRETEQTYQKVSGGAFD